MTMLKKNVANIFAYDYSQLAPEKSGVGIGVLNMHTATQTRLASFFMSQLSYIKVMVGCAGASSEAPVYVCAGYANPVQLTTSEIGVSGGDSLSLHTEFIAMMTTPTQTHSKSQYRFRFLALCATGSAIIHITAPDEHAARGMSPAGFVMVFAARLPAEVNHA